MAILYKTKQLLRFFRRSYWERRERVLDLRRVKPSTRIMYRLVNKHYALMFERMMAKPGTFSSFGESRSIPAATEKSIQFFTYTPESQS